MVLRKYSLLTSALDCAGNVPVPPALALLVTACAGGIPDRVIEEVAGELGVAPPVAMAASRCTRPPASPTAVDPPEDWGSIICSWAEVVRTKALVPLDTVVTPPFPGLIDAVLLEVLTLARVTRVGSMFRERFRAVSGLDWEPLPGPLLIPLLLPDPRLCQKAVVEVDMDDTDVLAAPLTTRDGIGAVGASVGASAPAG